MYLLYSYLILTLLSLARGAKAPFVGLKCIACLHYYQYICEGKSQKNTEIKKGGIKKRNITT
jgi:hypothetical protein